MSSYYLLLLQDPPLTTVDKLLSPLQALLSAAPHYYALLGIRSDTNVLQIFKSMYSKSPLRNAAMDIVQQLGARVVYDQDDDHAVRHF
jgi:hypothetical protein